MNILSPRKYRKTRAFVLIVKQGKKKQEKTDFSKNIHPKNHNINAIDLRNFEHLSNTVHELFVRTGKSESEPSCHCLRCV